MEKVNITIETGSVTTTDLYMEPSHKVMEVAQKLSIAYPGCTVNVQLFVRIRRSYKDGEIVSSRPDLTEFYTDVSEEDKWTWSMFGQEKE
jgi:hypothetical protein